MIVFVVLIGFGGFVTPSRFVRGFHEANTQPIDSAFAELFNLTGESEFRIFVTGSFESAD
ncbi:MAG: hypothetical protein M3256_15790 [Actinomycetota bacterium]|nr:hypothetical protein [Actinomycetota bacterium]